MADEEEPIEEEQEQPPEQEDDKEGEEDEEDEELNFYIKFTRALIFALPEPKDRVLAASWVKKIKTDEHSNEKLKTDYIKLLIFALQRRKLVGIFSDDPTNYEQLEEFAEDYDLNSMASDLIEIEMKERIRKVRRELQGHGEDFPPYTTDISANLREYVAAQDIPGFGVQCYYAISKDPITAWNKAHVGLYARMAKSAVDTSSPLPPGMRSTPSGICVECPGPDGTEPCNPRRSSSGNPSESDKKPRKKLRRLGDAPPVKPLVAGPQPEEEEERKPPTWSSNLMDVLDRPRPTTTKGAISKKQLKQMQKEQRQRERYEDACGDSELDEDYSAMERTIKDFRRGEISEQSRKRKKQSKADDDEDDDDDDDNQKGGDESQAPDFENFLDLEESEYEQELREDSILVKYFRDTLNKRTIQKNVDTAADVFRGTLPAQVGIPLTTPKPSVSPRRLKASPPVFIMEEDLPQEITKETDTSSGKQRCSYVCSGRDPEMDKLFQQASALARLTDDDLEADFGDICGDNIVEEEEEPLAMPQAKPPPYEPMQPIGRGSPAAHKIFAEVVPPLLQQLQPSVYEEPELEAVTEKEEESEECPPPSDGGRICRALQDQRESQLQKQPMSEIQQSPIINSQSSSPFPTASENRPEYIDYLFGRDRETAYTFKRISHMVSDFEQDQPEPFTPSPSPSRRPRPVAQRNEKTVETTATDAQVCTNKKPCRAPCASICNQTEQKSSGIRTPMTDGSTVTPSKVFSSTTRTQQPPIGLPPTRAEDERGREGLLKPFPGGSGVPRTAGSRTAQPGSALQSFPTNSGFQRSGGSIPISSRGTGIPPPTGGRSCPFSSGRIQQPIEQQQLQSSYFPQSQPQRPLSAATSRPPTVSRPNGEPSPSEQQKRICPTTAGSRMLDFDKFKADTDKFLSSFPTSVEPRANTSFTGTPGRESQYQKLTSDQLPPSSELSPGMQQMLKRLPEAESYLGRCRGKRGVVFSGAYMGPSQTPEVAPTSSPVPMSAPSPMSSSAPMSGPPPRNGRVNVPPTAQYSSRPVQGSQRGPCPLSLQRSQGGLPPPNQGGPGRGIDSSSTRNPVPQSSRAGQGPINSRGAFSQGSSPGLIPQGPRRQMLPCPRSEMAGQNSPANQNTPVGQDRERPLYKKCPNL